MGGPLSKQDIRRGRKSVQQLFTMCRRSVQSQQSPGALPWSLQLSASRLPSRAQLFLGHSSLPWKTNFVPTVVPNLKKEKNTPPKTKRYRTVFCTPNRVFRTVIQMWYWMQNVWGEGFTCQVPRWKFPLHSKRSSPVAKET